MGQPLKIESPYTPSGDQPQAIDQLVKGLAADKHNQTLLGVTGSGKTFTMAHVIERTQRPALILAHNKTLAAQLYSEMKRFFPENAVEYFVSYYDYYQPEAYVARSDTFIEKDSSINEQIDRLRHSATRAMLERRDVICVASVSCIYGIGSVDAYKEMTLHIATGDEIPQRALVEKLVILLYERNDIGFKRGTFRVRGDTIDVFPAHMEEAAWRLSFFGDELETIIEFDPLTGERIQELEMVALYANSHHVTTRPSLDRAIITIKEELKDRLNWYYEKGMVLEAQRLEQRTTFDLEMLMETGMCKGIENYSRHFTGAKPGEPPPTLFQYLPKDALLFIDESHVTLPQIKAMYKGDRSRKSTLQEYGFRLPSCMDNRPLKFEEWDGMRPDTIFVSATPSALELEYSGGEFAEQVIRPTGLIDPPVEIRPVASQVDDLMAECRLVKEKGYRVLATTLTKKMAEQLSEYLDEMGLKVRYLHSDIDTLERVEIIRDLRLGVYDVLVGVNLLREGLDIPECGLMAILDADKEGFLRSATALIQTIGRAARNADARVILYADKMTDSMKAALEETDRRREKQVAYNTKHNITPTTVSTQIGNIIETYKEDEELSAPKGRGKAGAGVVSLGKGLGSIPAYDGGNLEAHLVALRDHMLKAASELEFETAARIRDEITKLEAKLL